jgi:hypothetical protein
MELNKGDFQKMTVDMAMDMHMEKRKIKKHECKLKSIWQLIKI